MPTAKRFSSLCVVLVAALLMSGCAQSVRHAGLEPIGIMGALDSEIELIKQGMRLHSSTVVSGRTFYEGDIEGHRVVLVKAGVGKVNAAMTAQIMTDRFKVRSMIFTGIAGGVNPELHVEYVVISNKVIQHDYGLMARDGFHPGGVPMSDTAGTWTDVPYFEPDSRLVAYAMKAAGRVSFPQPDSTVSPHVSGPIKVFEGCIVTGDQFIASEEKRVWLQNTFDAYATEMEGAAVAQVSESNGVPFVIIRTLSDLANEDADIDIAKFFSYAAHNSAMLVLEMLRIMP
jgi:adenosylhomocysteine nucleosidase